jgi:hypothetical protein
MMPKINFSTATAEKTIPAQQAPYYVLELTDTIQDIADITSDIKAIMRSQSLLLDASNQFVVASHVADILVDVFNRIFHKNIPCKVAQVIVRVVSMGNIYVHDDCIHHPEQMILQGLLLLATMNDLTDASQMPKN